MEITTYVKQCTKYNTLLKKKRENTCSLSWIEDIQNIHTDFAVILLSEACQHRIFLHGMYLLLALWFLPCWARKWPLLNWTVSHLTLVALTQYTVLTHVSAVGRSLSEVSSCSVTLMGLIRLSSVHQRGACCLSEHRSMGELQSLRQQVGGRNMWDSF